MSTPISGVDANGELPMDADDYINAKIYSMLGDCTEDSLRRYQLEMAQKTVLRLQQEVRELQGKLQVQAVRYAKVKEEASMNAIALKTSIATCESLKEELSRWMFWKSCLEERRELACNVRQGKSLPGTELQLGRSSSSDPMMDVYGDGNMTPKEQAGITSEGLEDSVIAVKDQNYP